MKTQELIERKFWFKVRKGVFQVLLPGILAFYTLFGYAQDSSSGAYSHLYFYTALVLMIQTSFRHLAEYIFDICSVSVIAGNVDLMHQNTARMIKIVRVFKTKYSSSGCLEKTVQICNALGIDTPILIPRQVVEAYGEDAGDRTDEEVVGSTIDFIQTYRPVVYQMVDLGNGTNSPPSPDPILRAGNGEDGYPILRAGNGEDGYPILRAGNGEDGYTDQTEPPTISGDYREAGRSCRHERAPRRIITSLDASIGDLQFEIFGESSVTEEAAVLNQV